MSHRDRQIRFGPPRADHEHKTDHDAKEVPDPYYGGEQGFEHVLDLLEDGCRGILQHIRSRMA